MIDAKAKSYALITGASSGLGAEFARQLAAKGHALILSARNTVALFTLAESLHKQHGVDVRVFAVDLSLQEGPDLLWRQVQWQNLRVDLLINNAGSGGEKLLDSDWCVQQAQFNLMTRSVLALCHHAVPAMVKRGSGQVINVASAAGRMAEAMDSNYGPCKAYVIALSQGLATEVSPSGVQVMALCPGFTHSNFHNSAGLKSMKSHSPSWLWYSAETVVREALQAANDGKTLYVSGRLYRWFDPLIRITWIQRAVLKYFNASKLNGN